jgi:phosphomannomutase/phosphoglucomutase
MLDRAGGKSLSDLYASLPKTWSSPTMSPFCPDDRKYAVVEALTRDLTTLKEQGGTLLGQAIASIVTVNGVRVTLEDGTWGLVRASSNKPSLVVVVESPVSEEKMRAIFAEIDGRLAQFPDVGAYDQKL